jgi:hypothetical protein
MKRSAILLSLLLFAAPVVGDVVLTIPELVRSEVGGPDTVAYDRIRTISVEVTPSGNFISMQFELFVFGDNSKPPYAGTYEIDVDGLIAYIRIDRLNFDTGVNLTPPQATAIINQINDHVANVEDSMITLGVVDGTQQ